MLCATLFWQILRRHHARACIPEQQSDRRAFPNNQAVGIYASLGHARGESPANFTTCARRISSSTTTALTLPAPPRQPSNAPPLEQSAILATKLQLRRTRSRSVHYEPGTSCPQRPITYVRHGGRAERNSGTWSVHGAPRGTCPRTH